MYKMRISQLPTGRIFSAFTFVSLHRADRRREIELKWTHICSFPLGPLRDRQGRGRHMSSVTYLLCTVSDKIFHRLCKKSPMWSRGRPSQWAVPISNAFCPPKMLSPGYVTNPSAITISQPQNPVRNACVFIPTKLRIWDSWTWWCWFRFPPRSRMFDMHNAMICRYDGELKRGRIV